MPERPIAVCFAVSTVAALALAAVYWAGGQPQAEGALLGVSLGGMGIGVLLWAARLLPEGEVTGERGEKALPSDEQEVVEDIIEADKEVIGRRRLLTRLLGVAAGALGVAALFPIRSLGPSPGDRLSRTHWHKGVRLVDQDGKPIRADGLSPGGAVTAFPEHAEHAADSQVILVKVAPDRIRHRRGREEWAPEGNLAYSKICTHVGCPVGLYQETTHELVCPCHQSTFDVLDGARPQFGPATRSLPQLPLSVDAEGFLVARSDFTEPVGPGYWNRK